MEPQRDTVFRKAIVRTAKRFFGGLALALAVLLPWGAAGQTNISLPDSNLESALLSALGKTNGPITTADMLGLTNLTVGTVVTNLSGLEYAANLESLYLYSGNVTSLSPLSGLLHLRSLSVESGYSANLTGLSSLTALTNLDLYSSTFTNASGLVGLTNMIALDLSWTRLSDLVPLAGLPHLQYLDLSGNPLGNCAALAGLTNLSGSLYLDNASLTNIAGLGGLTNLTELTLYQDQVNDLKPLANLTSLAALDLADDSVRDFSALAGMTNLQSLFVEGTAISNLNRLPLLPRLTMLDANYNRLGDLNALAGCTNLQWLNASYNCLTNIDALTNLSQLRTAYLQINLLDTNTASANMNVIQALLTNHASVQYTPQHAPPATSLPGDWLVPANENSSMWFSVSDDLTPVQSLVLSVRSSNPGLVTAAIGPTPLAVLPVSRWVQSVGIFTMVPNAPSIAGWSGYLNLTAVPNQTGTATITVTATDDTGLTTDTTVAVTVSQPVSFDSLAVGNANSNVTWSTFGANPWQGQTNVVHDGGAAAQGGSQESWLEAEVTGPGLLTFWWKYSATNWAPGAELTATCADSGLTGHVWTPLGSGFPGYGQSTVPDWQESTLSLPAGRWALRWQYAPGPWDSSDELWVADVTFTPGPPVCWLEHVPSWNSPAFFSLYLHGPPGETYDVEASPDLRHWSRVERMTLSDFQAEYTDPHATAAARFYRMHKPTLAPMWLEKPRVDGNKAVQLTLHSEPAQPLSLEYSTNLLTWETLVQTNNVAGTMQVADGAVTNASVRFYRAKALAWGGSPALGIPGLPPSARRHPRLHLPIGPGLPVPLPTPPILTNP
jgi:hypothetical protein